MSIKTLSIITSPVLYAFLVSSTLMPTPAQDSGKEHHQGGKGKHPGGDKGGKGKHPGGDKGGKGKHPGGKGGQHQGGQ